MKHKASTKNTARVVVVAMATNTLIALTKVGAGLLAGSAALLAEGALRDVR